MKGKLDAAEVRRRTEAAIVTQRERAKVMAVLHEVLKAHEGKIITARIATALKTRLGGDYSVYWKTEYSWYAVEVWSQKAGLDWNNRLSVMIAYKSDAGKNGDGRFAYDYWVQTYSDARTDYAEWANRAEQALRTLDAKVAAFNAAYEAAEAAYDALDGLVKA